MRPKAESKLLMGLDTAWWIKHESGATHVLKCCDTYDIEIANYRGPRSRMNVYVLGGPGSRHVLESYCDVGLIDVFPLVNKIMARRDAAK